MNRNCQRIRTSIGKGTPLFAWATMRMKTTSTTDGLGWTRISRIRANRRADSSGRNRMKAKSPAVDSAGQTRRTRTGIGSSPNGTQALKGRQNLAPCNSPLFNRNRPAYSHAVSHKTKRPENFFTTNNSRSFGCCLSQNGQILTSKTALEDTPTRACPKAFLRGHASACYGA